MDNILEMAFSLIPPEPIQYQKWLGKSVNSIGRTVATYGDIITTRASIQPVGASLMQQLGLSLSKNYYRINISADIVGVENQKVPDRMIFKGKNWLIDNQSDWYVFNGWVKLIVVEEKNYD